MLNVDYDCNEDDIIKKIGINCLLCFIKLLVADKVMLELILHGLYCTNNRAGIKIVFMKTDSTLDYQYQLALLDLLLTTC